MGRGGIEPPTSALSEQRSTTELPAQILVRGQSYVPADSTSSLQVAEAKKFLSGNPAKKINLALIRYNSNS